VLKRFVISASKSAIFGESSRISPVPIADEIVTKTMMVIKDMDDQIDQIEDEIFADPQRAILELIFFSQTCFAGIATLSTPPKRSIQLTGTW